MTVPSEIGTSMVYYAPPRLACLYLVPSDTGERLLHFLVFHLPLDEDGWVEGSKRPIFIDRHPAALPAVYKTLESLDIPLDASAWRSGGDFPFFEQGLRLLLNDTDSTEGEHDGTQD